MKNKVIRLSLKDRAAELSVDTVTPIHRGSTISENSISELSHLVDSSGFLDS